MLKTLHIRNLAIIDALNLEIGPGFTVLTGETGAGKSILIDALGLVMGTRADASLVRSGQDKAEISAEFHITPDSEASRWLAGHELLDADEPAHCLIRRVVFAEGRTRAFVNGQPVNAGPLRELGECLIEIFGQSESQTLLRADIQRALLDGFGAYPAALQAVAEAAGRHQALTRQIERLRTRGARDPAELDYLRFQLQELEALQLEDGELERLETDQRRLANAGQLLTDGGRAQELLYGGEASVYDQLSTVCGLLNGLVAVDPAFEDALRLSETAQAQVHEAADALRRTLDRLDLDPAQLEEVDRRLGAIHDLARKHRIKAEALPDKLAQLRAELEEVEQAASSLDQLEQARAACLAEYHKAAATLSGLRQKAAQALGKQASAIVRELGMPNAQLQVRLEAAANDAPRSYGLDDICFDFSANPGQPPRPLAKVASGGELSRVSLALQVVGTQDKGVDTMIFDEVDAGIGGGVAEIVGRKLRELGSRRQVLCVTHLAQVAAQSQAHFSIRKEVAGGETYTRVRALKAAERVDELARMQGGVEVSQAAREHAQDLLQKAGAL